MVRIQHALSECAGFLPHSLRSIFFDNHLALGDASLPPQMKGENLRNHPMVAVRPHAFAATPADVFV